jgi:hypothetical protein
MARLNLTASAYRIARRRSEIAREEKWRKTADVVTKKRLEEKKRRPAEPGIEGSGGPSRDDAAGAEDPMGSSPSGTSRKS